MTNKETIEYYFEEVWNKGNLAAIDEVYHPHYTTWKLSPWRKPGTKGLKDFIADNHRMFPDVHQTVEDIIAEGDKVVARISGTATHKGDLTEPVGLVPATNKKVAWRGIFIFPIQRRQGYQNVGSHRQYGPYAATWRCPQAKIDYTQIQTIVVRPAG